MVWEKNPALGEMFSERVHAALRNYREWERRNRVFEETCAFQEIDFNLTGLSRPERVEGARASPNFFTMLGVRAGLGRVFTASEHGRVAVLTHALHRKLFAGDPGVLGRTLALNGNAYTVAGVLPPGKSPSCGPLSRSIRLGGMRSSIPTTTTSSAA